MRHFARYLKTKPPAEENKINGTTCGEDLHVDIVYVKIANGKSQLFLLFEDQASIYMIAVKLKRKYAKTLAANLIVGDASFLHTSHYLTTYKKELPLPPILKPISLTISIGNCDAGPIDAVRREQRRTRICTYFLTFRISEFNGVEFQSCNGA